MKYLIFLLVLFTFLISGCEETTNSYEEDHDCPHGLENDPYPGNCGLYVDEDANDICDHSE